MPWKEEKVETIRKRFVAEVLLEEKSKSALCKEYGISRPTGDKWIERYKNGESLSNKSHEPKNKPNKTAPEKEYLIIETREKFPTWGARKIKRYLENNNYEELPTVSTISEILKRNNLISPEESKAHTPYKRFEKEAPNDLWQMDFKGHFGMLDGGRCHGFTSMDDNSRYNLALKAQDNEKWESTKDVLENMFREYGLPKSILCDNGKPWGDCRGGYTEFDLWMMQLNILPIHGRPLHPQTQGKEERFHRTLKNDLIKQVPMKNLQHAQQEFDKFRYIYNNERPHNALNLDVPAKHYKPSKRLYPDKIKEPEYDLNAELRKINCKGYISVYRHRYYLGESFAGKYMEITHLDDDCVALNYGNFKIAVIDLNNNAFISKKIYLR